MSEQYQPTPITPADFEGVIVDIDSYNSRTSGIRAAVGAMVRLSLGGEEFTAEDAVIDQAGEADIALDLVDMASTNILDQAGLTMIDRDESRLSEDRTSGIQQKLVIKDPNAYVAFLDSLPSNLEDTPKLNKTIWELYGGIVGAMKSAAQSEAEGVDQHIREAAVLLGRILPSYQKFEDTGGEIVDREEGLTILNWSQKPEFIDFLRKRKLGLGDGVSFNASQWHLDMSPDIMNEKWQKLMDHYVMVKDKYGEGSDLTKLMKTELAESYAATETWLRNPENRKTTYIDNLRPAINQVGDKLLKLGLLPEQTQN